MHYRSLAVAAVLAALLAGCGGRGQAQHGPPPLNVDTAMATRRDIATFVTLDGQVAPLQDSTLAVQQPGPLVGIYVNEGDRVSAGQLLAKVDDSNLRAQLEPADGDHRASRGACAHLGIERPDHSSSRRSAASRLRARRSRATKRRLPMRS